MIFQPHAYQTRAVDFIESHPFCAVFMEMGLGKTVVTLTALKELKEDYLEVGRPLVIAPKSVARNTWASEASKWDHLSGLRISLVMGTPAQRRRALEADADLWVTNRDNVSWLVNELGTDWDFDTVILDESSSFKNWQSKRWKKLNSVRPLIRRMVLLTGTPAPNGLMDLWAQFRLLDKGERLGRFIGQYRSRWFHAGAHNGAVVYDWIPNKGARESIAARVADITMSMRSADYLELPDVVDCGMTLEMGDDERKAYRKFEKDCVMNLEDGGEIEAVTAVALANKLLQFASGAVYDSEHDWHEVGSTKMEALADLLEQTHEPVLLYYNYRHEQERILEEHPEAVAFRGEPETLERWNKGEIPLLLAHPASTAYGLNMQQGGHIIVWYSPTWDLELYQQANARLHRQGQDKPVMLYHLVCAGTMDETVVSALAMKEDTQSAIMNRLKTIRDAK